MQPSQRAPESKELTIPGLAYSLLFGQLNYGNTIPNYCIFSFQLILLPFKQDVYSSYQPTFKSCT